MRGPRHPGVDILPHADDLFAAADEHDLVVVAAPNRHTPALGLAAIEAGLHLVVDKPLAAGVEEGERLAGRGRRARRGRERVPQPALGRRLPDAAAARRRSGSLGELHRLESRFERWRPEVDAGKWREGGTPEDAGGVLFDLGPHVIDQALELLGPARSVYAEVRTLRPGAEVDDDFFVALEHESGARSHLSATMLAAQVGPRFRALGTRAAYVKWGLDVQEDGAARGRSPGDPGFGEEPPRSLGPARNRRRLRARRDRARPLRGVLRAAGAGDPRTASRRRCPLEAGVATLRVIEAARRSSAQRAVIPL